MSTREEYLGFAKAHPNLFANPPGAGFVILLDEDEIRKAEAQMAQWLESKSMPAKWAHVGIVYRDQYRMILRDAVRFPNGLLGTYVRIVRNGVPGVIVFPIYQGQILLIRHFRHSTRTWHIEVPRGYGEEGSSGEENARRELKEEIGATISRLVSLGQAYPDTGAFSEYNTFFYAEVETYGAIEADEAIVELLPTPIPEFERMIRENEIEDGFTITAYGLARARGLL